MTQLNANTLLVVDDEPHNVKLLKVDLERVGYQVLTAYDGLEGWDVLHKNRDHISAILLDRMMPNMNGMEFMKKLKEDESVAQIPVIMLTAAAQTDQVAEGIQAGVYYYMTKPYEYEIMLSVIKAAISDHSQYVDLRDELKIYKRNLNIMRDSHFVLRTLEEARFLSIFLSNFFAEPERAIYGISELLINAIEHGNLGITYNDKTELKNQGTWEEEVERRLTLPENKNKKVHVYYENNDNNIMLIIKDDGDGFDWQEYLEITPERALDNHGRGIAMSKIMSFDDVEYRGKGNEVVCTVSL